MVILDKPLELDTTNASQLFELSVNRFKRLTGASVQGSTAYSQSTVPGIRGILTLVDLSKQPSFSIVLDDDIILIQAGRNLNVPYFNGDHCLVDMDTPAVRLQCFSDLNSAYQFVLTATGDEK